MSWFPHDLLIPPVIMVRICPPDLGNTRVTSQPGRISRSSEARCGIASRNRDESIVVDCAVGAAHAGQRRRPDEGSSRPDYGPVKTQRSVRPARNGGRNARTGIGWRAVRAALPRHFPFLVITPMGVHPVGRTYSYSARRFLHVPGTRVAPFRSPSPMCASGDRSLYAALSR